MLNNQKCNDIQNLLDSSYAIYNKYMWLLDSYVSNFYLENHWEKLPKSWREALNNLDCVKIANIIDSRQDLQITRVLPLSLLALREAIKCYTICRCQQSILSETSSFPNRELFTNNGFHKLFWKHVKFKKKHEIEVMAQMCYKSSVKSNCFCIIDVGSGLGHLSRLLSYGYGLKVYSLELQINLSNRARKIDDEIENAIEKYCQDLKKSIAKPQHINVKVDTNSNGEDILKVLKAAGTDDNIQFGIVGLHPCGDLGATLLRFFKHSSQVKFINIVGCCYMKLSTNLTALNGYPLSKYCINRNYDLSYPSREIACHALENYVEKLCAEDSWKLKVHAYRAGLEKVIVQQCSILKHSKICGVKYTKNLTFAEYCIKAVSKLPMKLNINEKGFKEMENELETWKLVVIFYSVRLMLAPLVENIILLDRLLFMTNSGYKCDVTCLFNPSISPRNQILSALK